MTTYQGRLQADAQDARASTKLMDLEVCLSNCTMLEHNTPSVV